MPKVTGGFSTKNSEDIDRAIEANGGLKTPVEDLENVEFSKAPTYPLKDSRGRKYDAQNGTMKRRSKA